MADALTGKELTRIALGAAFRHALHATAISSSTAATCTAASSKRAAQREEIVLEASKGVGAVRGAG